jgi:molybdopterin/thiamine biosynthesis adenylyltransferase
MINLKDNFDRKTYQPIILNPRAKDFQSRLLKFLNKKTTIIDKIADQLEELFLLRNPKYRFIKDYQKDLELFLKKILKGKDLQKIGYWIYYPWNNYLVHSLDEKLLFEIRTARNLYLISKEEQKKFYNARIAIAGLSVGSYAALTITMTGGSKFLKIADPDEISASNLNRIRTGIHNIGVNKAIAVSRQIYEINPFAKLEVIPEGINEKNIEKFLLKPKVDLLIEEMDNLYLKIKIREIAKKYKIPVIMAADNGDNIIVDIERFDLKPNYPILHGLVKFTSNDLKNIPPQEIPKYTAQIAGADLATPKMLYSVLEVGKSIYSWTQLGNAATLCGVILTYLARKIINREKIIEGRIDFNVDKLLSILPKNYEKERESLLRKLIIN